MRTLRRWRAVAPRRALWHQVVLPLAGHGLVALLFLALLPTLLGGSLAMALHTAPALGYTLGLVGALALGWGLLRTALVLALLRQRSPSLEQAAPARA